MSQSIIFYYSIFLFGQNIFLIGANAQQNEMTTTIVDESGLDMHLKWVKTEQFLANEHLPVWSVTGRYIVHNTGVMKAIGKFATYHDLDKSSAVVYLQKCDCLFGTIDVRYAVVGLPIKELNKKHIIGISKYIIRQQQDLFIHHNSEYLNDYEFSRLIESIISNESQQEDTTPTNKRQHSIDNEDPTTEEYVSNPPLQKRTCTYKHPVASGSSVPAILYATLTADDAKTKCEASIKKTLGPFYPEIILFVSHETLNTRQIKVSLQVYLAKHVLYYIVYMNAVSMLFAKLSEDVKIHINIAGIMFEEIEGTFPFSRPLYKSGKLFTPTNELVENSIKNFIDSMDDMNGEKKFSDDAFDFFLFLTIFDYTSEQDKGINRGVSTGWYDIFTWRANTRSSSMISNFLGSIVDESNTLPSYVDTAHEIAHLMQISDDFESHAIMRNDKQYHCPNCLEWSPESIKSFRKFFSENTNRCFLLNEPRSLYKYDVPRKTLSPAQQCECYGFTYDHRNDVKSKIESLYYCSNRIRCMRRYNVRGSFDPRTVLMAPPPVDGTPCLDGKVCWSNQCVPIPETRED